MLKLNPNKPHSYVKSCLLHVFVVILALQRLGIEGDGCGRDLNKISEMWVRYIKICL